MTPTLFIIATLTVGSGIAAMSLRNLVHCALALMVTFAGLAAFYLQLDAQFVGFAQILVYVGAVAILIVFAILLTRAADPDKEEPASRSIAGLAVATCAFVVLAIAVFSSRALVQVQPAAPKVSVQLIGRQLMSRYILPLEVIGLLLTAALIGAVIIAMQEKKSK
jgi:NADH-quinone oxidoreductase subunit J